MLLINIFVHTIGTLVGVAWCFLGLAFSGMPFIVAVLVAFIYGAAGTAEIYQIIGEKT